jgi:hypothetical protein
VNNIRFRVDDADSVEVEVRPGRWLTASHAGLTHGEQCRLRAKAATSNHRGCMPTDDEEGAHD